MKQYTTRFLKTISLFYMGFPIIYLPIAALLFDVPAATCMDVLLSVRYYVLSILAVAVGYGFWEMKRWAWYLFVATTLLIGFENTQMAFRYGESHHKLGAFIASAGFLVLVVSWVAREVRVPYFFPKIRWWESNPRYRLSVPVRLTRANGNSLSADILDLSRGGCFIKLWGVDLAQDEAVHLVFTVFGLPIECRGIIVWRTRSTVTTPRGVGIKFDKPDRKQRRTLKAVNGQLKKIATLYRRSRYLLNQDEFLKKLDELEAALSTDNKSTRAG